MSHLTKFMSSIFKMLASAKWPSDATVHVTQQLVYLAWAIRDQLKNREIYRNR